MTKHIDVPQEYANAVVDPKAHENREVIDDVFTWFRKEAPLAQVQPDEHNPIWVVSKHADIKAIQKDNKRFFNGTHRSATLMNAETESGVLELTGRP